MQRLVMSYQWRRTFLVQGLGTGGLRVPLIALLTEVTAPLLVSPNIPKAAMYRMTK